MLYPQESKQIYYHILEGSPYLLADERCKKKLLDMTFDLYRRSGWRLYAFCVTDSAVHLLSVTGRHTIREECLQQAADEFISWCGEHPDIWAGNSLTLRTRKVCEVRNMEEVAWHCRNIHRIPLELGYVEQISDYWWSSYITYIESFSWEMVDCHAFSLYLSSDVGEARHKMKKFHASLELPTIYITKPF